MALSPSEEALVRDLIAQNAALLSLAASEPTILSKLGATKATLSDLPVASSLADTDLFLVRQGTTDKSVQRSVVASGFAALNGSASQIFNVAAGTSATQAVRFDQVLGMGQTWQIVTGSRAFGTTYTNTTGRPIVVAVYAAAPSEAVLNYTVNGVNLGAVAYGRPSGSAASCQLIVPAGATYSLTVASGSLNLGNWIELR